MSTAPSPNAFAGVSNPAGYHDLLAVVRSHFNRITTGQPNFFGTDTPDLFDVFLNALPQNLRQNNNCNTCRQFVNRYGGLVTIDAMGQTKSVFWNPEDAPPAFAGAIQAMAKVVHQAVVTGVFLSDQSTWGTPQTGDWHHFSVELNKSLRSQMTSQATQLYTLDQIMAEKKEDYRILARGLRDFPRAIVQQAYQLLNSETLYRSEKCLGVAKWLLDWHDQLAETYHDRFRTNLIWQAVATAPPGFCHVRSTMIGTLLEDLVAGLPFAQIKSRFDAKMNPMQYQRPTAAPTAGNVAQAEKIIEQLKTAKSLERRFAKLGDIQALWLPRPIAAPEKQGVFSHLLGAKKTENHSLDLPAVTMTWEKFARTVLPTASTIEYFVENKSASYTALITATHEDALPIIQWDFEDARNPITWYFYVNGSTPQQWNLPVGVYHPVTAITLQPSVWHKGKDFSHQGEKVFVLLKGAKDTAYRSGAGFYPEFLKSDYHSVRSTLEAYAKSAIVTGRNEAEACGLGLQKGQSWNYTFRVTTQDGMRAIYKLDRWD